MMNQYNMSYFPRSQPIDVDSVVDRFTAFTSKWNRSTLQSEHIATIELLTHGEKSDLIVEMLESELEPSDGAIAKVRSHLHESYARANLDEIYMELAESIGENVNVIIGRSAMVTEIVEQLNKFGKGGSQCKDESEIDEVCPATLEFLHVLVVELGWNVTSLGELEGCVNMGDDIFCLVHPDEVSSLSGINILLRENEFALELGPQMNLSILNPKYTLHWRNWIATPYPLEENEMRGEKKWDKNYPIDFSHMSTRNIQYLNILYARLDLDYEIIQYFINQKQILESKLNELHKQVGDVSKTAYTSGVCRISAKRKRL